MPAGFSGREGVTACDLRPRPEKKRGAGQPRGRAADPGERQGLDGLDGGGHPDFVFLDKKIAIFVDGCFWHGHDCRNTRPSDNADYWTKKRERNIKHDKEITELFEQRGWTVIRIWECELKKKNRELLLEKLRIL